MTHRYALSFVALALCAARATMAQTSPDSGRSASPAPSWSIGAAYLRFGTMHLGLRALNEVLDRNGRPTFTDAASMIGMGAHLRFGRLLVGASGETSLPHRREDGGWVTQLSAGTATIDGGIALVERGSTMVASLVSLGIRRTGLRLEQRGQFTYDEGVLNPARGVVLSSRSGVVQPGLMLEQRFRVRRTALGLTAQAGVSAPFGSPSTFAWESRVGRTPLQQTGTYLRIAVGKPLGRRGESMSAMGPALLSMIGR